MKNVLVTFERFRGESSEKVVRVIVASNNIPMGRARAQSRLWKILGIGRFDYRTVSARFVN